MNYAISTPDILKSNKGKKVEVYMSFPHANDWKNKTINGIIEGSSNDSIIISNPTDGNWYLVPLYYIDFIMFEENINIT